MFTKGGKRGGMEGWLRDSLSKNTSQAPLLFNKLSPGTSVVPSPRYGHSTVTVEKEEDGRDLRMILVFGGMDEAGNYLCDLYAFDPSNNTWTLVDAREKGVKEKEKEKEVEGKDKDKNEETEDPLEKEKESAKTKKKKKSKEKRKDKKEKATAESPPPSHQEPTTEKTKRPIGGGGNEGLSRNFASMVEHQGSLFVFGGKNKFFLNNMWRLDLDSLEWEKVRVNGKNKPSMRMGHSAVVYHDTMWVFGGYDSSGFACNDLWTFSFATLEWTQVTFTGEIACRYHHGAIVYQDSMFVFGGKGDMGPANAQLLQFDFAQKAWSECHDCSGPSERWGHAFAYHPHHHSFVVQGGQNKSGKLNDYHEYDIDLDRWQALKGQGVIEPRAYHSMLFLNDTGYLFGGLAEKPCNDVIEIWDASGRLSLQTMPPELGLLIMAPLSTQDLGRAMCVCRNWHAIASDDTLWKNLAFKLFGIVADDFKAKVIAYEMERLSFRRQLAAITQTIPRSVTTKLKNPSQKGLIPVKLVMIGDGAVGKSSCLATYTTNAFPEYIYMWDPYTANVLVDGHAVSLTLWDTAGQDDYDRLRPLAYLQTDIFIIAFSLVNRKSFEHVVSKWVPEATGKTQWCYCNPSDQPFILCGMKSDLYEETLQQNPTNTVTEQEARELAEKIGALGYFQISSLMMVGLRELFDAAIRAGMYEISGTERKRKDRCAVQ